MKKRRFEISTLECTECGLRMYVPRPKGAKRPKGHIKHMYCVRCDKRVAFTELGSRGW